MLDSHFVILGSLINVAGTSNYIFNTLRGQTKPNRVSFFMWTLAPMVAFAAELQKGSGLESLVTFTAGFCPLLILLASFKDRKSYWRLTAFDFWCGGLSILGLILWAITRQGNLAIFFSIVADFLAALPTITKSYTNPETESWLSYFASGISAIIGLLTVKHWAFANYAFPIYLFLANGTLVYLIRLKPAVRFSTK